MKDSCSASDRSPGLAVSRPETFEHATGVLDLAAAWLVEVVAFGAVEGLPGAPYGVSVLRGADRGGESDGADPGV